jgi:excisionase family DNA binding protein
MEITKKCKYCGKQFIAQTLKTQYCSHQCNSKHYKIRQREIKKMDELKPPIQKEEIIPFNLKLSQIKFKEFVSLKEALLLLGISRTSLWRLIKNNHITSAKLGSRVFLRKKDLKKLLNNQIDNNYFGNIILNKGKEKYKNEYFSIGEITENYCVSSRTIERHISNNNLKKIKKGRFVYVLKSDVIKLFGKPQTPKKNG